jgi:hypothetical protein
MASKSVDTRVMLRHCNAVPAPVTHDDHPLYLLGERYNQKRLAAVTVPGITPEALPWETHSLPQILYKYVKPERLTDLTKCLIRFSQRKVFEDTFELFPEVAQFGTTEEIMAFMESDPVLSMHPQWLKEAVIAKVKLDPLFEANLVSQTKGWLTTPDEFAVLCLTEHRNSERMWAEYADHGRGFLIAFDTSNPNFGRLREPGKIGKVEYNDKAISSFLSVYGPNAFFRKRTQYEFEAEWRSIRHLKRFAEVIRPEKALPIYLAPFDPASVREISIRKECSVEWELRHLTVIDSRYRHVPITVL